MRTIERLLIGHPGALARYVDLVSKHDVWIVGGAARWMLHEALTPPRDIDLLCNTARTSDPLEAEPTPEITGSGGQGQKEMVDGVVFDIFENDLLRWLKGVPLVGDRIAIRASDSFALFGENADRPYLWTVQNPGYRNSRPEYAQRHRASLDRDTAAIFIVAGPAY